MNASEIQIDLAVFKDETRYYPDGVRQHVSLQGLVVGPTVTLNAITGDVMRDDNIPDGATTVQVVRLHTAHRGYLYIRTAALQGVIDRANGDD